MRRLITSLSADVVVANTSRATYVASVAAFATSTPLVVWVRDYLYSKSLLSLSRRTARHVVFVSEALRRFYESSPRADSVVWNVASDLHERLPQISQAAIERERARYGFGPEHHVVGFMGRLVKEKGPEDVIDAAAELSPEFPRLRLLVVGSGKGQPNDIEPALHAGVARRGIGDVVRFAGFQSDEALYYSLFDLFVIASRDHEAYPTSVVQAMMAAKPVIGSIAGGIPEIVRHGVTGLTFEAGDVPALVAVMREMLSSESRRAALSDAGRREVMSNNLESRLAALASRKYLELAGR
jgi:glycosyltransferase involved in cell wall biosynthesis